MTEQDKDRGDRDDRARSDEEPGEHSGAESQAQTRTVPGTASAEEGYQPERGTTAGRPLEGVEAPEGTGAGTEGDAETGDRPQEPQLPASPGPGRFAAAQRRIPGP